MTALPFATSLPTDPGPDRTPPPEQSPLVATLTSTIEWGTVTSPRSLQVRVGASEVGHTCQRRLAYALHETAAAAFSDPMRLVVGTGVHLHLEQIFRRFDGHSGRLLVEHPVEYRGVPGVIDLFDQYLGVLVDWKTTGKTTLARYIKAGIPVHYRVQAQIYAAGLAAQGYDVRTVAVVFLPYDGALSQAWDWQAVPDRGEADRAIDRLDALRADPRTPDQVPASPDRLCGWCPWYRPRSTDLARACPGLSTTA